MILLLFLYSFILIQQSISECPNKTYGTNCTSNCTNCSIGCDISGSCYNGSCVIGFYGSGCKEGNIALNTTTLVSNNCFVQINSPTYNDRRSYISAVTYYLLYDLSIPKQPLDYSQWRNNVTMDCTSNNCQKGVTINDGTYSFAVYFRFIDLNYSNPINSLASNIVNATCNSSSNPPVTILTTTTTPVSTASTTPSTVSTTTTVSSTKSATTTSTSSTTFGYSISSTVNSTLTTFSTSTLSSTIKVTEATMTSVGYLSNITSNYTVQNLSWSNSSNYISLKWSPPPNNINQASYQVIVQDNGSVIQTFSTSNLFQNITNLAPGRIYNINVNTIAGSQTYVNPTLNVCTDPAPNVAVNNVQVVRVDRKSITVTFPTDQTNYTCTKNIYRLAAVQAVSSSRRKRDVSGTTLIPSGTALAYNSTDFPNQNIVINNLGSATNYKIYAEISTNINGILLSYSSATNQPTNGPTDGVIAGIFFGLLILLILILVILLLLFRYRKKKQESRSRPYKDDNVNTLKEKIDENKPRSYVYWSEISDKMEPRYLQLNISEWTNNINKFEPMSFTNQNYFSDGIKFSEEYTGLPNDTTHYHTDAEINYAKNKKQDIFPYDHNRVKLRRTFLKNRSDYINASFIDGYLRKKAYIASQSPFDEDTNNDFWAMVYEQNIGQIIMLTEAVQRDEFIYWPQMYSKHDSKEVKYGNIRVKIMDQRSYAHYDIRLFEIEDTELIVKPQFVTQYQFHSWPKNDIPENIIAFLDFYQAIKVDADISNGPLLVHCDTGTSQSAVYIAFDILNTQVIHENCVNVFRTVAQLRRSRPKMIRNIKQYMFIYDLLFESLLCGQFIVNINVRKIYKLLHRVNPQSGMDYLHEQFTLLQTYHMITACHCQNSNEISFLDSIICSQNLTSVASPTVQIESIDHFWNSIYKNKIDVIIDIHTTDDTPYYIRDNLQNINVSTNKVFIISESFRKFELTLYHVTNEKRMEVTIYQLGSNWVKENDINCAPHSNECGVWIELIDHLIINHSNDRILAHCTNMWSKSGLFLTCLNVATKIYLSKYVMVYNVVKSMKFYRSEFITSFDQYRFIYTFLKKWVDIKMANEVSGQGYLHGLLMSGDKLIESLFTHEQTPVLQPEEKQKFAPSLQTLGSREYNQCDKDDKDDSLIIVHYNVGKVADNKV